MTYMNFILVSLFLAFARICYLSWKYEQQAKKFKRGLYRAAYGFNQIERCGPSSDPASSLDAQQLARSYAQEIKGLL